MIAITVFTYPWILAKVNVWITARSRDRGMVFGKREKLSTNYQVEVIAKKSVTYLPSV